MCYLTFFIGCMIEVFAYSKSTQLNHGNTFSPVCGCNVCHAVFGTQVVVTPALLLHHHFFQNVDILFHSTENNRTEHNQ